ncbi:MAG TPA: DNA gyrase inhibitor YacG [Burkholderiales bacterium]|nr:DNA gyrase inhibitor YacG [Burkholderiales bacterium]
MGTETGKPRIVICPGCGSSLAWSRDNPWRPFCSERCKLIDLGQWATGAYRIPQEEADDGEMQPPDQPEEQ